MAEAREMEPEESTETQSQQEETPTNALLRAAYEGNVELMVKMLSDGIPVDVANQGGLQAIHFAAKAGRVESIEELLTHGASVDAKSTKGNTPLHVAALLGQAEVVKLLLRRGSDVNTVADCNDDEFTPLYMAAQIGHQEIVTLLLANGADPTLPTQNGCTASDVALQQGYRAVSELLVEYEKRLHAQEDTAPPGGCHQNGTADDNAHEAMEEDEEAKEKLGPLTVRMRENVVKKARPKSGPPPVCEEPIPSPKPSPLKTKNRVSP